MNRRQIVFIILGFVFASCNFPNRITVTPPSTPIPALTSRASSTPTLIPIETLLALPTATFAPTTTPFLRLALAIPIDQPVNCRYGPGTAYAVVGSLDVGKQAEILGKNIDVTWWHVRNPSDPSTFCWLASEVVDTLGNLEALPVIDTPPGQVSEIRLRVDPPSLNVGCQSFPQYVVVNADIITNGPAMVVWRWETSEGESVDKDPVLYLEFGAKSAFIHYGIYTAKDYWIQVHILSPNNMTERIAFKATCTP